MCALCDLFLAERETAALPPGPAPMDAAPGATAARIAVCDVRPPVPRLGPCRAAAARFRADSFTLERRARLAALQRHRS